MKSSLLRLLPFFFSSVVGFAATTATPVAPPSATSSVPATSTSSVQAPATSPVPVPAVPLAVQLDEMLTKTFPAHAPGAAVIVVNKGEVILRKAYGMANLELGVPMQPDHVFRLGSITKQFTAVAILQLVEAGKLQLDDDFTTYVPGVDTGGQKITLTHLLTHTSGLPDFTNGQPYQKATRNDLTTAEILALIKGRPTEFPAGTDWRYSNTNYLLLGMVIEKVSGQSYAAYMQQYIFKPAGMTHTRYDDTSEVIPLRVPGYTSDAAGKVRNADYVSMSLPQGAGGLISNVDDLWSWEQALAAGKLVSPALLEKTYTAAKLADGRGTGYGFGRALGMMAGHELAQHGGGIQGFLTFEVGARDAGLYVAVLCNSDRARESSGAAMRIATLLLGKPAPIVGVTVPAGTLGQYVGVYRENSLQKMAFVIKDDHLEANFPNGSKMALVALSPTAFVEPLFGNRYTFVAGAAGSPQRVLIGRRMGPEQYSTRVAEPLMDPKVVLPPEALEKLVGEYALNPQFIITIRHVGDALTAQATGQGVIDLVPASATRFTVKQVPAAVEFQSAPDGTITGLVLDQGGRRQPGKKIK